jgi:hypothetical protein
MEVKGKKGGEQAAWAGGRAPKRACRHERQSSGAVRRRAEKLDTRRDAMQSAAAAQMRCGEFWSASVAGSVQLERGAASGVQVQAQASGGRAVRGTQAGSVRHRPEVGDGPAKDGLIATNRY